MTTKTAPPPGLPAFVFDLHRAAARVAYPPSNAMPEELQRMLDDLLAAVIEFESFMPTHEGNPIVCANMWTRHRWDPDF